VGGAEAGLVTIERRLRRLLTAGTWLSTALLGVGLLVSLTRPHGSAAGPLLAAGLIMLMATPIARVVLCVVEFTRQRDWWFAFYTSVVLAILIGSVIAGWLG
jgi:hypothetical protein